MAAPEVFLPSRHAFAFSNRWPKQPAVTLRTPLGPVDVGNAQAGLCGGMVFAALDYWRAGRPPPEAQPAAESLLYRFLVRRLVDSWDVPRGVLRYYRWMRAPDDDRAVVVLGRRLVTEPGTGRMTASSQWPAIRRALDAGEPVPLGVVAARSRRPKDLALNHQVLAFGYTPRGSAVELRVYDPNRGPRDDITLTLELGASGTSSRAGVVAHGLGLPRPVRGVFRTPYRPVPPPGD
jgi:hypothetical protein